MIFEDKIPVNKTEFLAKLKEVSDALSIPPQWLMAMMWSESGLKSDAGNSINCVGLIGFCPDTSGGTYKTIDKEQVDMERLRTMKNYEQLEYVKRLYYPYRNKLTRFVDLYLFNFYPYAVGRADDYVVGSEKGEDYAKKVAAQNKGFDVDHDGKITIKNFKDYLAGKFKDYPELFKGGEGNAPIVNQEVSTSVKAEKFAKRNWIPLVLTLGVIAVGTYLLFKNRTKIIQAVS